MSDNIVGRLRARCDDSMCVNLSQEAADEIERLQLNMAVKDEQIRRLSIECAELEATQ